MCVKSRPLDSRPPAWRFWRTCGGPADPFGSLVLQTRCRCIPLQRVTQAVLARPHEGFTRNLGRHRQTALSSGGPFANHATAARYAHLDVGISFSGESRPCRPLRLDPMRMEARSQEEPGVRRPSALVGVYELTIALPARPSKSGYP